MAAEKQRLIIISAGAFGREICAMAWGIHSILGDACPWHMGGFLDSRPTTLDGKDETGVSVLASPEDYRPAGRDRFICAIGDPRQRQHYAEMIARKGGQFLPLTWPGAVLAGHGARRGAGSVIGPFCVVSSDVSIGVHSMLTTHVTIGHDVTIGLCSHIGAYVFIGGAAVIGDRVTLHPHACILPGAVIEDDATVGPGSVVLKRVCQGETVFGVPAQPVRA